MSGTPVSGGLVDDQRVKAPRPLIPPAILLDEYPLTHAGAQTVLDGRRGAERIISGQDDRLLVVVGPCSIHHVGAALEYADLLHAYCQTDATDDLHILMRVYFEKPRTTVGWKGLINDPQLNGSYNINQGLRLARGLLCELATMGLPTAVEYLDVISPQFLADLVSWGAIGARTTESQIHRELASGLSSPVGFKNGTQGDIAIAVDAMRAAEGRHTFLSVTKQGLAAIVETTGNDATHVIMRGSNAGPNYEASFIADTAAKLRTAGLRPSVMVDCSHGNSQKKHERQLVVAESVASQLADASAESTRNNIMGVMIESNLVEGNQKIPAEGPEGLVYGKSITDACLHWNDTLKALERLREGVRARRKLNGATSGTKDIGVGVASKRAMANGAGAKPFNDLEALRRDRRQAPASN